MARLELTEALDDRPVPAGRPAAGLVGPGHASGRCPDGRHLRRPRTTSSRRWPRCPGRATARTCCCATSWPRSGHGDPGVRAVRGRPAGDGRGCGQPVSDIDGTVGNSEPTPRLRTYDQRGDVDAVRELVRRRINAALRHSTPGDHRAEFTMHPVIGDRATGLEPTATTWSPGACSLVRSALAMSTSVAPGGCGSCFTAGTAGAATTAPNRPAIPSPRASSTAAPTRNGPAVGE